MVDSAAMLRRFLKLSPPDCDPQPANRFDAKFRRIEHLTQCIVTIETRATPTALAKCNTQQQSALFKLLPPEIRAQIFEYALAPLEDSKNAEKYGVFSTRPAPDNPAPQKTDTSVLLTCRLVWLEANHFSLLPATHYLDLVGSLGQSLLPPWSERNPFSRGLRRLEWPPRLFLEKKFTINGFHDLRELKILIDYNADENWYEHCEKLKEMVYELSQVDTGLKTLCITTRDTSGPLNFSTALQPFCHVIRGDLPPRLTEYRFEMEVLDSEKAHVAGLIADTRVAFRYYPCYRVRSAGQQIPNHLKLQDKAAAPDFTWDSWKPTSEDDPTPTPARMCRMTLLWKDNTHSVLPAAVLPEAVPRSTSHGWLSCRRYRHHRFNSKNRKKNSLLYLTPRPSTEWKSSGRSFF